MSRRLQSAYKKIQKLSGEKLTESICRAVMFAWTDGPFREKLEQDKSNPFSVILLEEWYRPSSGIVSRDLAEIFLAQIEARRKDAEWRRTASHEQLAKRASDSFGAHANPEGFVRLDGFIRAVTSPPVMENTYDWLFYSPDIAQILWAYFEANRSCLDEALHRACELVYHGVPLYVERDGKFTAMPDTDDDYIYLSKKAEYDETGSGAHDPPGMMPVWAERYFFRQKDLVEHRGFFGIRTSYHNERAVEALRTAFRSHIGMQPKTLPQNSAATAGSESQRNAAEARWKPLKSVRARAIELYEQGKPWKSRAAAGRAIRAEVVEMARKAGNPLSADNALDTIDGWLKDAQT